MSEISAEQPTVADANAAIIVPPAPPALPSELPGRLLRAAREGRGLSVTDVAQSLKFGPRQIEALEADDFSALRGATFVRGFVRSYAKFLKLDPQPLLAMLDEQAPAAPADVRPPEDTGAAMPEPGGRRLSPWVAGAVVLAVIAAALSAWHFTSPEPASAGPVAAANPAVSPAAATAAVQPAPAPQVQAEVLAPQVRIEQAAGTPAAAAVPATADAPLAPPAGRQLVLTFQDKSWVEIKDAGQRVVLSGEFPAGARQVATGKAPFSLWVGRASAVRIMDGDREIDLKPHARDEVARLTVE